jgi:glutamate-5-semialdehyde dehydrogenase
MNVTQLVRGAKLASRRLAQGSGPERRSVLLAMADILERPDARAAALQANARDTQDGESAAARGELDRALVDRLVLDARKLDALADGLRQLAGQTDLVGRVTLERELDDDLVLRRVTCPLGVLGVVFEARPDAVPQIVGLAMRTGNAVILKGGSEAARTNAVLVQLLQTVIADQGFDPALIGLLHDRTDVATLLGLERDVDLIIARGSGAFVRHVQANTTIPVLGHAEGLCHLYLHASADPNMAARIAVDAKCSYPAACNAIETLLWDAGAERALDVTLAALAQRGVTLRGCPETRKRHPDLAAATEADWGTEYGTLELSVRQVTGLEQALEHIDRHGSKHTEAIVAEDERAAVLFMRIVDAAGVFHNASTRFADGYRFGLGAEVGVSTSKLHARGPVGVEGLLTYRWLLEGRGQIASDYGPNKRLFKHRDIR